MHHIDEPSSSLPASTGPWYKQLSRYHWFVFIVAALGWLFDCLDQQLFLLARMPAMQELVVAYSGEAPHETALRQRQWGDVATSLFIAGWACGGLLFGMMGDRIGRAKTMMLTILIYSGCTGLSALSYSVYDFIFYRFITGMGVGGEFAVGVALIAEVMPASARPYALGSLQSLSAIGNVSAALIFLTLGIQASEDGPGLPYSPWRIMFTIGAVPALLALVIRSGLKEPEQWEKASHDDVAKKQLGSYGELFRDPTWRKHALLGLVLGCAGIIGLWSVGFYSFDLIRTVQTKEVTLAVLTTRMESARSAGESAAADEWSKILTLEKEGKALPDALKERRASAKAAIDKNLTHWPAYTSIMLNLGAFFGMYGFGALAQRIGRKPTFTIALTAALASTVITVWFLSEFWQIFVLVPIMGFCQLSLFAGYAIYFPELFPTRLRSTGTSFCYNVGRFVAALGPLAKLGLDTLFSGISPDPVVSLRYTGITMCSVFLIGFVVLPFLPETKGKPLPE